MSPRGSDRKGQKLISSLGEIIDVPVLLFSYSFVSFNPCRQVGHGRAHIDIVALLEQGHADLTNLNVLLVV